MMIFQLKPWNVATISKEDFNKTIMDKQSNPTSTDRNEEEKEKSMKDFVTKNEAKMREFGCLSKCVLPRRFLIRSAIFSLPSAMFSPFSWMQSLFHK